MLETASEGVEETFCTKVPAKLNINLRACFLGSSLCNIAMGPASPFRRTKGGRSCIVQTETPVVIWISVARYQGAKRVVEVNLKCFIINDAALRPFSVVIYCDERSNELGVQLLKSPLRRNLPRGSLSTKVKLLFISKSFS